MIYVSIYRIYTICNSQFSICGESMSSNIIFTALWKGMSIIIMGLSIYLFIYLSLYLFIYLSIYLCIYLCMYLSINSCRQRSTYPLINTHYSLLLQLFLVFLLQYTHQTVGLYYNNYDILNTSSSSVAVVLALTGSISGAIICYLFPSISYLMFSKNRKINYNKSQQLKALVSFHLTQ